MRTGSLKGTRWLSAGQCVARIVLSSWAYLQRTNKSPLLESTSTGTRTVRGWRHGANSTASAYSANWARRADRGTRNRLARDAADKRDLAPANLVEPSHRASHVDGSPARHAPSA